MDSLYVPVQSFNSATRIPLPLQKADIWVSKISQGKENLTDGSKASQARGGPPTSSVIASSGVCLVVNWSSQAAATCRIATVVVGKSAQFYNWLPPHITGSLEVGTCHAPQFKVTTRYPSIVWKTEVLWCGYNPGVHIFKSAFDTKHSTDTAKIMFL